MSRQLCVVIALLLVCLAGEALGVELPPAAKSPLRSWSFGIGAEFESGKYGGETTLDTWRVPLLIGWAPTAWLDLNLEIPYLQQTGTSESVLLGGRQMPRGGGRMAGTPTGSGTSSVSRTESGLGDITLDVGLRLLAETEAAPKLRALFSSKFPTADSDRGLGTGEFDWGGGLGVGKIVGDWAIQAQALYMLPGSSALYDPSAYWDWSAGLSYLGGLHLRPGLILSGGTAAFAGEDDPLEVSARLGILRGGRTSLSFYLKAGLSDASPDWGGGITWYFDF